VPDIHKLHVVTYVWHPGEKEPDVAAQQVLETPADPKTGVEGDATKAVLSKTENFQCAGEHGTDGCTKCHPHAEERVIARLIENDRVAVAWRKYHPLAAKGTVQPGEPFEAEHEGVKVRVEARVVTEEDKDVLTPKAVSMVALRNLEVNLQKQQQRGRLREQMRQQVDQFATGTYNPQRQAFDALAEQTKDLPGADAVLKTARDAFDQILVDARDEYLALANHDALDANVAAQLPVKLQGVGQRIAAALQPVQQLEANGRALAQAQAALRAVVDQLDAVDASAAKHHADLPGLDVKALPHADALDRMNALLDQSRNDPALTVQDLQKATASFAQEVQARGAALQQLVQVEQQKRGAFDTRVSIFTQLKDGSLKQALSDYVDSCGAAEGFNVKHWLGVVGKAVDAVAGKVADVDGLSYHRAADEKKLAAAEQKVGPLTQAIATLNTDVKKRLDAFPVHAVGAHQLTPPSVWIKVERAHDDGSLDVTVHARNNGAHALALSIKNGDSDALFDFALSTRGEHGAVKLNGVKGPFGAEITAVGAPAARGANAQLDKCSVIAAGIAVAGEGSVGHILPLYFTPAPKQPRGHAAQSFAADAAAYTSIQVPEV
jgi:hypothetical protein